MTSLFFIAEEEAPPRWPVAECYLLRAPAYLGMTRHDRPFPVIALGSPGLLYQCLREGAIDFVSYPADAEELVARILARVAILTEQGAAEADESPLLGDTRMGKREARLLGLLRLAGGATVTREALQYSLWGEVQSGSRRLDVLVSCLRGKLAAGSGYGSLEIVAERGEGYALRDRPVDNLCKSSSE
ncbi:MAG: winged helix-turn-helix domain-containing protein [Spirochaetota bacterium]